jgi:putative ABC transport system permease protein
MDLKFGFRSLRRNPGFATVAILTLAIGIGANAAVFAVADAVLFRPLPYEEPGRVVILHERSWPPSEENAYVAPANFFDWRERNRVFMDMALLEGSEANLTGSAEPQRVYAHRVSGNFFGIVGVNAMVGRGFLPEDSVPETAPVVVISHALWQRAFRGDPGVVGRTIRLDESPHAIVGITPADFSFNSVLTGGTPDLWVSAPVTPELRADRRHAGLFLGVARLRAEVTLEQAQAEMDGIAAALAAEYPEANANARSGAHLGVSVGSVHQNAVSLAQPFVLFSMALAGLVLLIACINVANMLLARAAARRREFALRAALGAGRRRMVRQLLTESVLLAVLGGAGGLLLARLAVAGLLAWGPHPSSGWYLGSAIPLLSRVGIDARGLTATTVMCVVTVVVFGLAPALRAAGRDPLRGLRIAESSTGWRRRFFDRNVLVAVEVALSLVLLIGVGLLGATFARLYDMPKGFNAEGVQVMAVELPRARYMAESGALGTAQATWTVRPIHAQRVRDIVQRVERLPGVDGVAAINIVPFGGGRTIHSTIHSGWVHVEGRAASEYVFAGVPVTQDKSGELHYAALRMVTPGYFQVMDIPLLGGRDLSWSDDRGAPGVVIVDRGLADWYWPGETALGKRVQARIGREWRSLEVVGVVGTVWQHGFYPDAIEMEQQITGRMYIPYAQPASAYPPRRVGVLTGVNVVARHRVDEQAVAASMMEILRELDPEAPVARLESMENSIARNLADRRFHLLVIGSFSGIAAVLALIGVYGVMAFQVGQRVHEIGVRMALGARATGVVRMVVGEGSRVAALGALMGVAGAMAATRLLSNWLYGVSPTDPVVFVPLAGLMVGAAVLACWLPARRAAQVDPMTSLRAE